MIMWKAQQAFLEKDISTDKPVYMHNIIVMKTFITSAKISQSLE